MTAEMDLAAIEVAALSEAQAREEIEHIAAEIGAANTAYHA